MSFSSENIRSLSRYYPVALLFAVYSVAFNRFSVIDADTDLWGHIKFGETIWSLKALPATNTFSYTAPDHPWLNHEWLTEVLFYLIYDAFDSSGLLIFKLLIGGVILTLLLNLYLAKEKNIFVWFLYCMFLLPVLSPGFLARPHLMTYLFLTILVFILHKFFEGNRRILIWTPFLMTLWVNCHGGFLAGIGIYGAVAGTEWARGFFTGEKHGRTLMGYFLLSCLATLVNPHGAELLVFLYQSLSLPRTITEWDPVPLFDTSFAAYKILCLLFLATLFLRGRKRLWEILIIILTIVYGFKHQRHTLLAAIVMTPYLSLQLADLVNGFNKRRIDSRLTAPSHAILLAALVIFSALQIHDGVLPYRYHHFKIKVEPRNYPVYAVRFLMDNRINGNIVAPFEWGEYLIWKLPLSRVAIDGRFRTAYPEKVIELNQKFMEGRPGWLELLEGYPTEIVITRNVFKTARLLEEGRDDWLKIYQDIIASVYIRKTTPPSPLESRYRNNELIEDKSIVAFEFP